MKTQTVLSRLASLLILVLPAFAGAAEQPWAPLFNGKNLDGWTPKISGHVVGDNFANTFRVQDGMIQVSYGDYGKFDEQYGHLFSNIAYSHYILRMEYRFTGKKMEDAPSYTNFNSGVMIHAQTPQSMGLRQSFPASMEVQFLADEGKGKRQTANVCTPGTNLELKGKLVTDHIVKSTAPTFQPEEWVKVEVEVHGSEEVIHRINGVEVLRYQRPQLDPRNEHAPATDLLDAGANKILGYGHIALQAEGQPVWFRNIELKSLEAP